MKPLKASAALIIGIVKIVAEVLLRIFKR